MAKKTSPHKFHIPVMGLAYTIDTPVKVAKYGISSTISIMEDHLIEQMRECLCNSEGMHYQLISEKDEDYRAKRITAYLNLVKSMVDTQIERMKLANFDEDYDLNQYFKLLPESSKESKIYNTLNLYDIKDREVVYQKLKSKIIPGSIDVNIMTKLDKTNFDENDNELPQEYSDALSALRGFANSDLESSIVFSAGMNPRLYSYCEKFPDFFPDKEGKIKKKIVLKVSDFRSALIQGKFLAKKGLFVSEFRVESGINCGGHAFVSDGILFGPILEEFKVKRDVLLNEIYNECNNALIKLNLIPFSAKPRIKITAQGGVGTAEENEFLLKYYNLDSIGWGSPFLLVPEVTNVDVDTLNKLASAKKEDYYLSNASPLGVPINNFKLSSSEEQRINRIKKSKPGSPCYKKFLSNNKEFTDKAICTASRQYQKLKIEQLKATISNENELSAKIERVMEKDCLCEGLGAAALIVHKTKLSHGLKAVAICPGPNLAYFSGTFSLKQMVDHIYGKANVLNDVIRPNCFMNELELYMKYLKNEIKDKFTGMSIRNANYFQNFKNNLNDGIQYYENIIRRIDSEELVFKKSSLKQLRQIKYSIKNIIRALDDTGNYAI